MAAIALRVLTQEGLVFEDEAASIIAPGEPGYLGILCRHAPLVTTLVPGTLSWRRPSGERVVRRVGAGLLEIVKNRCTVLTDRVDVPPPADAGATTPAS